MVWKVTVARTPLFDNIILCALARYVIVLLCYEQMSLALYVAHAQMKHVSRTFLPHSTVGRSYASPRFRSVLVITSALHAEGPRFDPGRNHLNFYTVIIFHTR